MADISGDRKLEALRVALRKTLKNTDKKHFFTKSYDSANQLKRLRFGLEKLGALQQQYGFDVVPVIFPFLLQTEQNATAYRQASDIVRHEMTRLGFEPADVYPLYKQKGLETFILREGDGVHPNGEGHRLVAEELYRRISPAF
jgi:hypothetical protein